ncbi:hypothetical protein WA158_008172 [Blastocystis sp. Blastoise]
MNNENELEHIKIELQRNSELSNDVLSYKECVICYGTIGSYMCIIPSCLHLFCADCLRLWSKNSNCCPICRKRYYAYASIQRKNMDILVTSVRFVPYKDIVSQDEYPVVEDIICTEDCLAKVTQKSKETSFANGLSFIVQCDSCGCWYHGACIGIPAVSLVPKVYTCTYCRTLPDLLPLDPQKHGIIKGHLLSNQELNNL